MTSVESTEWHSRLWCDIPYDCHSDDSRGVIYDRNNFIVQATGGLQYKNIAIVNDVRKCGLNLEHHSKSDFS